METLRKGLFGAFVVASGFLLGLNNNLVLAAETDFEDEIIYTDTLENQDKNANKAIELEKQEEKQVQQPVVAPAIESQDSKEVKNSQDEVTSQKLEEKEISAPTRGPSETNEAKREITDEEQDEIEDRLHQGENHRVCINFIDTSINPSYNISSSSCMNASPGVAGSKSSLPLKYDRFEYNESIYEFDGWYDEEGNPVTTYYTAGDPTRIRVSYNADVDKCTEVNYYLRWKRVANPPIYYYNQYDYISDGSKSSDNTTGHTGDYTNTFRAPSEVNHYEFLYYTIEDEKYYPGDKYTIVLGSLQEDTVTTVNAYAWWQPSVTLEVYKHEGTFNSTNLLHEEESTIDTGNKITLLAPEQYGYTKPGYDFAGYYMLDETGAEVEVPVGTVFDAPEITKEKIELPVYKVYAKWERKTDTITITKVWEDNNDKKGYRPDKVEIELVNTEGIEETATYELTGEGNTWTKDVTVYPYDEEGNSLNYYVNEFTIDLYDIDVNGFTITNTLKADGKVTIKYLDIDEPSINLADTIIIEDTIGRPYESTQLSFDNYRFVRMDATPEGTASNGLISEEPKEIIYYYAMINGIIRVHHVDTTGTYISLDKKSEQVQYRQVFEGAIGEEYNAQPLTIYGYENIATDGTDFNGGNSEEIGIFSKVGKFTREGFDIFFVYKEQTGKVTVKYIDIDNNVEFADSREELTGNIDLPYETVDKTFTNYTRTDIEGEPSGTYGVEPITVIYKYTKNNGKVIVKYVDIDNEEAEFEKSEETLEGKIGTLYETVEKSFENYSLVSVEGQTIGLFNSTELTVTYRYSKNSGKVTVHHIDKDTQEELDFETVSGKIGTTYTTQPKSIELYDLVQAPENPEITFTEDTQEVTYYYAKSKGKVEVHYVDLMTGLDIDGYYEELEGYVDETYNTVEKEIDGYEFVRLTGTTEGNYPNKSTIEVTYFYQKIGKVVAHYYEVNTENSLAEDFEDKGPINTYYVTEAEDIEGYSLVETPENANDKYKEELSVVIYYYQKLGKVITHYLDDKGNELIDSNVQTGVVGDGYTTEPAEIEGYELTGIPSNAEGNYTAEDTNVNYIYSEPVDPVIVEGTVYVKHIMTTGTVLEETEITDVVGTSYETAALVNEDLELVSTTGTPKGTIPAGESYVIYIYKEKEEPTPIPEPVKYGTVIAHYVDENGNAIASDVVLTQEVGTTYVTSQKVIPGYTGSSIPSNRIGEVAEGVLELEYTYTKDEEEEEEQCNNCCCNNCNCEEQAPQIIINIENNPTIEVNPTIENNNENNIENNPTNTVETGDTTVENNVETGDTTVTTGDTTVENNTTVETGDNNITTGDTNVTTGDVNVENNPTNNVDVNNEANPTNNVENNTDVDASSTNENNNNSESNNTNTNTSESNPTIDLDNSSSSESNPNTVIENNPTNTNENSNDSSATNNNDSTNSNEYNPINNNDGSNTNTNNNENNINTCDSCEETQPAPQPTPSQPEESKKGKVIVRYVDEEGYSVSPTITIDGNVDERYATDQLRINGYEIDRVEGEVENSIKEEPTYVTYYYRVAETPKQGKVLVHYVDIEGNAIADDEVINGTVGDEYVATEKVIDGYRLLDVVKVNKAPVRMMLRALPAGKPNIGQITEDLIELNFIYEAEATPVSGKVIVQYLDNENYTIAPRVEIEGTVDEDYLTEQVKISGYEIDRVEGEVKGSISEGTTYVTYFYNEVEQEPTEPTCKENCGTTNVIVNCNDCDEEEPKEGQVITYYMNTKGETLSPEDSTTGLVGQSYETSPKTFEGLKLLNTIGNENGNYIEGQQVVIYIYEEETIVKVYGELEVQYVDTEGKEIADKISDTKEVGDPYQTTQLEIPGYNFVRVEGNPNGEYVEGKTTVVYVYEKQPEESKKGKVIVNYVDINRKKIHGRTIYIGTVGKDYNTQPKTIDGYYLVNVEGETTGKYIDGEIELYYIYESTEGTGDTDIDPQPEPAPIVNGATKELQPPKTNVDYNDEDTIRTIVYLVLLSILSVAYTYKKIEN